jgi:hypothetical protein
MMGLIEPPAQYDHPYPGQVVAQRLSLLQIIQLCHGPASSCAWVSKGVCYIALPQNEKDSRLIALMRQHEIGTATVGPDTIQVAVGLSTRRKSLLRPANTVILI